MTHPKPSPSVLTFGEAMAMFVAETPGELATVEHFQRRLAGADNNVAIGLARLGFDVAWMSRVGSDSFGQFIRQALEAEGVDSRHIHTDPSHPTGLLFKERAEHGADPKVTYFRRGSAASHLCIEDAESVDMAALTHLHATGITPALSESAAQLSRHMMQQARAAGASVSFDPNLRPTLWPSDALMRDTLNALAARPTGCCRACPRAACSLGKRRPRPSPTSTWNAASRRSSSSWAQKAVIIEECWAASLQALACPASRLPTWSIRSAPVTALPSV